MSLFKRLIPTAAYFRSASVAPRQFPTTGFTSIPFSTKLEEENWPWYTTQSFYPVRIGEVIHSKYQVLYKIGYGTTATVWMCRDLDRNEYVCMKSMVSDYSSVEREVQAYEALTKVNVISGSTGKNHVRQALDHFELLRGDRNYHFLIHEPLGVSLQSFVEISNGHLPVFLVKDVASQMLRALEFIHSAGVTHADIQARNILLRIQDETILKDCEEAEIEHPSSRKATSDLPGPLRRWLGGRSGCVLCDFGEARTGQELCDGLIQPAPYRAPEVVLNLPWSSRVDIWNLGCMVWHLALGRQLLPGTNGQDDGRNRLARMIALLGLPPEALLSALDPRALEFFNEGGSPKGDVPNETLESVLASSLQSSRETMTVEESQTFLAFIRRALTWSAKERPSAAELLNDPWISQ